MRISIWSGILPATGLETPLILVAVLLIVTGVGYGMVMLAASRRDPRGPRGGRKTLPAARAGEAGQARQAGAGQLLPRAGGDLSFVFMMPCLNEEKVILSSLQRLLSIPGDDFVVMVIDDGSDDRTVDVLSGVLGDRVWLLSRKPPQARQGKGEALNAGVRYLVDSGYRPIATRPTSSSWWTRTGGSTPSPSSRSGRTSPIPRSAPCRSGSASTTEQSLLARMQDMEFVIYTEVFQRGRRHLGSVGLGGNGQFMRLSAMMSLGPSPWTRSLTDDLDLGVRLIAAGWRNEYCASVAVHQQGVVELRRLIRQRSRWFQGHLQSWKLIPLVLRRAPGRARADLLYHLSSPAILLIASLLSASFVLSLADGVARAAQGRNPLGWWVASTYALTFGPALAFGFVYWLRERGNGVGLLRTAGFAHMYVCYCTMWYASGWWAVARTLRGRTGWAKTDRVAEAPPPAPQPGRPEPGRPARRPEPGLPGRRPRRRVLVAAAAVVLAFAADSTIVAGTGIARHPTARPWLPVFNGYGSTSIAGSGPHLTVSLRPAPAASGRSPTRRWWSPLAPTTTSPRR